MTTVLITGTSTGIGRATALRLAAHPDLTVYASARNLDAIADQAAAGCRVLALDVTDEQSRTAAVKTIEAEHGQVDVLINNAGYGEFGAIEQVDINRVRAQFETNVIGPSRLTQLVLPGMRRAGRGRIINLSSMGGRLVFPIGGFYHASKYAVEAISDALRQEVRPFGIDVAVIEPGMIRSSFEATATTTLAKDPSGPYQEIADALQRNTAKAYDNRLMSAPPETVAKVIERAVTSRQPATRYVVTGTAKFMVHTRRLLGARVFDTINRLQLR
jgi:NAD(P)-dependent dehydrogenase (short-subunit alcohol dehydrogenase family)